MQNINDTKSDDLSDILFKKDEEISYLKNRLLSKDLDIGIYSKEIQKQKVRIDLMVSQIIFLENILDEMTNLGKKIFTKKVDDAPSKEIAS